VILQPFLQLTHGQDGARQVLQMVTDLLAQAGREDLWVEGALQDILAGMAGMLNR
jgi:hypothetical protein